MLGKTHMVVGVAATMVMTQPTTITEMILAVGAGALGALISDIDVGTSESHKEADIITMLSVGTVLMVIVLDYFFHVGIIHRLMSDSGYKSVIVGIILFICICAFGKEQPHRSFMHSFLALALLSLALNLIWKKLTIYFVIGFLSHMATDIFNKKKVRIIYPLKGGVSFGMFHAHGLANDVFFIIGSVIAGLEIILFAIKIF